MIGFAVARSGEAQVSLTPTSGSYSAGQAVTFTEQGYQSDNWVSTDDYLIWGSVPSGQGWQYTSNQCQIQFQGKTRTIYLMLDSGNTFSSGAVGANTILSNSICSVNLAGTTASQNGGWYTVVLPVTFTSSYVGGKDLYVSTYNDTYGWTAHYEGSITVTPESQTAAPSLSPGGGSYTMPTTITLSTSTSGASMRYTTDNSTPSETAGNLYSGPFSINGIATTVKAIAYKSGYTDSTVASQDYYAPVQTLPNDLYINTPSVSTGTYAANNTVNTSGSVTVPNGANVLFEAGSQVNLGPGFTSALGSSLVAKIAAPDFIISVAPAPGYNGYVVPGSWTAYTVTVTSVFGFTGTVSFSTASITGLPPGGSDTFSSYSVTPPVNGSGTTTVNVATTQSSPMGSFSLTISGTSGSLVHTRNFQLTIGPSSGADFTISATPSSQTVSASGTTTFATQISPINGFGSTVYLTAAGLPAGASFSFSPSSAAPPYSGTNTLTVTTSNSPAGVYYLTISGSSGSLSHSTVVSLVVNTTLYQITSAPTGRTITVDSVLYTAPQNFQWSANSSHTISAGSPQNGATGTQYLYSSWSDAGAQTHSITVAASTATYTANFTTQYYLTTSASPSADGSIAPASGWYNSGTPVQVSATANTGYAFSGFTGGLTGTTTPQIVTMNAPVSVTAAFGTFYTISGTVTVGGAAASGVTMTLKGTQSNQTTTDASGNYSFALLPPGSYTVSASSGSTVFCPSSETLNNLSANETANFTSGGPAREYIHLGARVIAIANCGAP